ncbi:SRPBCC family protein [Phytoactinopolyspora halotolerans]|uniref:ATPase n=1 Tax=Phytoactinopolyspora halotolerans TaxID=1981512 RepID=A0A6L9SER0_9ACTN|nr:SRPBCC family protein [Phytoactinopolyspora halotolerans]NEE02952.1 ATPase [Phytoactinopolyspora halotolerans]
MPVDVSTDVIIRRPRDVVASYAADPTNAPDWYVNIESVQWRTTPPIGVGSQMDFVARFLGRRLAYTYEIVELTPRKSLIMRTADGPFPMETTYTWEALGADTTRMTLRNRGMPAGFSAVLTPFLAAAIRRANRKDLDQLRAILERG